MIGDGLEAYRRELLGIPGVIQANVGQCTPSHPVKIWFRVWWKNETVELRSALSRCEEAIEQIRKIVADSMALEDVKPQTWRDRPPLL
jgi:hypothetical protein